MRTVEEEGVRQVLEGRVVHVKVDSVRPAGDGEEYHGQVDVFATIVELDQPISFRVKAV
jgi:hypothetical protein